MIRILDMSGDQVVWLDEPAPQREQRLPGYGERLEWQLQLQLVPVSAEPTYRPQRPPRYRR